MNDQTTNVRRYFGAGEQSRGMSADGGAIEFELGNADCGLRIGEQSMGETRYGERGLVALEVVGVPVRRVPAMDDEWGWLTARISKLLEVKRELAEMKEWALWRLLARRVEKVRVRENEVWRRWKEGSLSHAFCGSLVVWGSHGGRGGHGGGVRYVLGKGGVA